MVKRSKKINLDTIIFIIISIVMLFIPIVKIISYICNYIGLTKDIFVVNQVYVLYLSIPFLLTTYIVKYIQVKSAEITEKTDNAIIDKYTVMLAVV